MLHRLVSHHCQWRRSCQVGQFIIPLVAKIGMIYQYVNGIYITYDNPNSVMYVHTHTRMYTSTHTHMCTYISICIYTYILEYFSFLKWKYLLSNITNVHTFSCNHNFLLSMMSRGSNRVSNRGSNRSLIGALIGSLIGALIGALIEALIGSLIGFLFGALIGYIFGALIGAPIGGSSASKTFLLPHRVAFHFSVHMSSNFIS